MSVARGHDPRRFALVAIGGAGPMHACALADELGIPRVVIPRYPGVAAALGLLATDIRHDLRRSWLRPAAEVTPPELDAELERLEAEAPTCSRRRPRSRLPTELDHELDMRYRGQAYNLTVPFAARPVTAAALAEAVARFADEHRRLYDYTPSVTETEIVTLRVRALARIPAVDWEVPEDEPRPRAPPPAARSTPARWPDVDARPPRRASARRRAAPETIVEQEDATVVCRPAGAAASRPGATLVLERAGLSWPPPRSTRSRRRSWRAPSTTSPRRWRWSSTAPPSRRSSARCSTSTAASSPPTAAWSRTPSRSRPSSA